MNSIYRKPKKNSTSSERLATCSLICGITGIICSFLYLPVSLASGSNYPTGLICGVIGLILAVMSRNASETGTRKSFLTKAIAGIILSAIAIGLTFFFFYTLVSYYDLLRDPVKGPQINRLLYQMQEQLQQQFQTLPTK